MLNINRTLMTLSLALLTAGLAACDQSAQAPEATPAASQAAPASPADATPASPVKPEPIIQTSPSKEAAPVLNFTVKNIEDKEVNLTDYQGKVVLLINVASKCGYTKQYAGLETLYKQYKDQGLVILAFPANNFGSQEPGSNEEIAEFCESKFGITFPMFSKISVLGEDKAPLYQFLTEEKTNPNFAGEVKWNFEKFLISKDGKVVGRYASKVTPESDELVGAIKTQLAVK